MDIVINWGSLVGSAPSQFQTVVINAVAYLESILRDNITINIGVNWGYVNGTAVTGLGASLTNNHTYTATQVRNALLADATTSYDSSADATLANPIYNVAVMDANARALGLQFIDLAIERLGAFCASVGD